MKSVWDTLAKVGLIEAVEPAAKSEPPLQPTTSQAPSPVVILPPSTPNLQTVADNAKIAELDASARKILVMDLEKDDAPLLEKFTSTLESLVEAIPSEDLRISTALKLLTKQGHTLDALLIDFDKSIATIEESNRQFELRSKKQVDTAVGTKKQEVERMQAMIVEKTELIKTLQQEVANLAQTIQAQEVAIAAEESKIVLVQQRFGVVYNALKNEIQNLRSKIATKR